MGPGYVNSFACPNCREIYFRKDGIALRRPVRCSKCGHSFRVGDGEIVHAIVEPVPQPVSPVAPAEPPAPIRRRRWRRERSARDDGPSLGVWIGLGLGCIAAAVLVVCIVSMARVFVDAGGTPDREAMADSRMKARVPAQPQYPDPSAQNPARNAARDSQPSESEPRRPVPDDSPGDTIYRRLLASTVLVQSLRPDSNAKVHRGTGFVVSLNSGVLVTNAHVVGIEEEVLIVFPLYRGNRVEQDPGAYKNLGADRIMVGRVFAKEVRYDLALIRVDRFPVEARAIRLAAESPQPGERVHSIGNSIPFWVHVEGAVRAVRRKQWRSEGTGKPMDHDAIVVETGSPINPGDSGGPLVNTRGELVGVAQSSDLQAREVSNFIDISEVKRYLARAGVR